MRSRWWITGVGIVAPALALLARRTLVVVRVHGSSMLPTYADGDRLLAIRPRLSRPLRSGDVVAVLAPSPATGAGPSGETELLVKRVSRVERQPSPGRVFVAGDNSPSYDSHVFGPLPADAVVGRVVRPISTG